MSRKALKKQPFRDLMQVSQTRKTSTKQTARGLCHFPEPPGYVRTRSGGALEGVAPVHRSPSARSSPGTPPPPAAAECLLEGVSILERHQVIENRVDGSREVIEEARDVVEVLVDSPIDGRLLEVDVGQPLGVERGPAQEERHDNGGWKQSKEHTDVLKCVDW